MTAPLIAFPALIAFWLFVGWRVRVERGRVHRTAREMLHLRFVAMQVALGEAFGPVLQSFAKALAEWEAQVRIIQRACEASAAEIAARLGWM